MSSSLNQLALLRAIRSGTATPTDLSCPQWETGDSPGERILGPVHWFPISTDWARLEVNHVGDEDVVEDCLSRAFTDLAAHGYVVRSDAPQCLASDVEVWLVGRHQGAPTLTLIEGIAN